MIESGFWLNFLIVASTHFLAVLSPGPDFIITIRQSLYQPRQQALLTSIGIASGIAVHVSAALLGIAFFLQTYNTLFIFLQLMGLLYLIHLAYKCLKSKPYRIINHEDIISKITKQTFFEAWKIGFFTNLANIKAMMFFLALFTVVIHQTTPFSWRLSFGLWMIFATGTWFAGLNFIISNHKIRNKILEYAHWVDRITGIILLIICGNMLFHLFNDF